jgi:nucleotide-binding universal stress UspA family protein
MTFKRILVATDFGEASSSALELALELVARFEAELTLIHIWEFPSYDYMIGVPTPGDFADRISEAARTRMAATMSALAPRCPNAKSIVKMGVVWAEVLRTIDESRPDLLVVGTHGRQGLKRAILGSVAEKLVRSSPVPVLTVHGAEKAA